MIPRFYFFLFPERGRIRIHACQLKEAKKGVIIKIPNENSLSTYLCSAASDSVSIRDHLFRIHFSANRSAVFAWIHICKYEMYCHQAGYRDREREFVRTF